MDGQEQQGREFWQCVVAEFEGLAGQVQHWDFTEARGLNLGTFQTWLYKLRRERKKGLSSVPVKAAATAMLVPVEICGVARESQPIATGEVPAQPLQPIDVAFPDGVMVRFAAGTDPVYMSKLLCRLARGLR